MSDTNINITLSSTRVAFRDHTGWDSPVGPGLLIPIDVIDSYVSDYNIHDNYKFSIAATTGVHFQLHNDLTTGNANIYLYDETGNTIAISDRPNSIDEINATVIAGNYTLSVTYQPTMFGFTNSAGYKLYGWADSESNTSLNSSQQDYQNPLFDSSFYLWQNPDVAAAGMNPLVHYEQYGWKEGRDPDPLFDSSFYLRQNPDVAAAGINPLVHYEVYGWKEGRDPDPLFDSSFYLRKNPDVAATGINPLVHYEQYGWKEGRDPDPLFDSSFYLQQNPDVARAGVNPLVHYEEYGWKEGRDPNPLFDSSFYLQQNPDVAAAGMNPLVHYEQYGWKEGRDPHPNFNVNHYLESYPDVRAVNVDPLVHFEQYGLSEGRAGLCEARGEDFPALALAAALPMGVHGSVGGTDTFDAVYFYASKPSLLTVSLTHLSDDADLRLYDTNLAIIAHSENANLHEEHITIQVSPGVYLADVVPYQTQHAEYDLQIFLV